MTGKKKSWIYSGILIAGLLCCFSGCKLRAQPMLDAVVESDMEKTITKLLKEMSLEEKAGQMTQITLDVISQRGADGKILEPHAMDQKKLDEAFGEYHVGSVLNVGSHTFKKEHWQEIVTAVQETAKKQGKREIPVIYGIDAIHGATYTSESTLFPQELGLAATWDPDLVRKGAEITAYEVGASNTPWNFSPVADIGRQPLWSRFFETFGEDPYLASVMTEAMVKGYQGSDLTSNYTVAACLKHYIGYSYPLSGHDRTPAWIPERIMREYFLPSFAAGVKAGAQTVMINSGEVNGIPGHANKYLLTEVLRNELGFDGLAVSDWEDLIMLHTVHHLAPTRKEVVAIAINAGVDMSMVPLSPDYKDYHRYVVENTREGKIPMERIDEAVRRILRVKFRLGLFEKSVNPLKDFPEFGSKAYHETALEASRQSLTLLKNNKDILPLNESTSVLVTGPAGNSLNILNGAWTHTWQGVDPAYNNDRNTIEEAVKGVVGAGKFAFVQGVELDSVLDIDAVVKAGAKADVIIVCLGEKPSTEKPGEITDLRLPRAQVELVKALKKTGKRLIGVLVENRPQIIEEIDGDLDALIMAYLPGDFGGDAIAEVLFGRAEPGGRLPFTYPGNTGDFVHYDHKFSEKRDNKFAFDAYQPQYDFGAGMTYTTFSYSDLKLEQTKIGKGGKLKFSVQVKNTGKREGTEVVQVYVRDMYASIVPPVKRLRAFDKVKIKAGESKTISFELSTRDLAFVDLDLKWKTEKGEFELQVGGLSQKFEMTVDEFFKTLD